MFNEFYSLYPKKTNKAEAEKLFNELSDGLQKVLINDVIDRSQNHYQWQNKAYIPNPARYIRRKLWTDEIIGERTKQDEQQDSEDGSIHSRFWTMLKQMYGSKFINSFGATIPKAWLYGLPNLKQIEVTKILRYLATDNNEYMPDLPRISRIRRIGCDNWRTDQLALPVKKAQQGVVEAAIAEMNNYLR